MTPAMLKPTEASVSDEERMGRWREWLTKR